MVFDHKIAQVEEAARFATLLKIATLAAFMVVRVAVFQPNPNNGGYHGFVAEEN